MLPGDFKPKRSRAYRVPESLKPEVEKTATKDVSDGNHKTIKPSKSEMASPIARVLKGKYGKDGVGIAVDYRYLNKFFIGDAYPASNNGDIIQSGESPLRLYL